MRPNIYCAKVMYRSVQDLNVRFLHPVNFVSAQIYVSPKLNLMMDFFFFED